MQDSPTSTPPSTQYPTTSTRPPQPDASQFSRDNGAFTSRSPSADTSHTSPQFGPMSDCNPSPPGPDPQQEAPAEPSANPGTELHSQLAFRLIKAGYSPVDIIPGQKRPRQSEWQRFCETAMSIEDTAACWSNESIGIGVAGGFNGLVPIDVDCDDKNVQQIVWDSVDPSRRVAKRGQKGFTLFVRDPGFKRKIIIKLKGGLGQIEFLSIGQQCVIPPSIHPDTKRVYEWITTRTLFNTPAGELQVIDIGQLIDELGVKLKPWLAEEKEPPKTTRNVRTNDRVFTDGERRRYEAYARKALEGEVEKLRTTPEGGGKYGGRDNGLHAAASTLGKYVCHGLLSQDEATAALLQACEANGNGLLKEKGRKGILQTIHNGIDRAQDDLLPELEDRPYEQQAGSNRRDEAFRDEGPATENEDEPKKDARSEKKDGPKEEDGRGEGPRKNGRDYEPDRDAKMAFDKNVPEGSEEQLAQRFADLHYDHLRYVHPFRKWFEWTDIYWKMLDKREEYTYSRQICQEAARQSTRRTNSESEAKRLASNKTHNAVVELSKSDPRLTASVDQWDKDRWLLNTPDRVVDLRTGDTRKHNPLDYQTKLTAVGPGADCPQWKKFLDRITGGDEALIAFLKRVCGYMLTGSNEEHALFFLYGTGANGKTVFINIIAYVLKDYHVTASIDLFTASNNERHPTELARLQGARVVSAGETEKGKNWAENKIKAMTGGDRVAARFLYKDYFEYDPQYKIIIAGNHKPGLQSVDEAMRRRIHLIPFTVTIPPHERDSKLTENLRDEGPGIFQWMLDGVIEWQEQGLAPPESVREATDEYLNAEDALEQWLEECCEQHPDFFESSAALFDSWKAWATRSGEAVGARNAFSSALLNKKFNSKHTNAGNVFLGLQLKYEDRPNENDRR